MTDTRAQALEQWAGGKALALTSSAETPGPLTMISGDASFRRYFRLCAGSASFIAVDAPPEHEDGRRFVAVARLLQEAGVMVPRVFATDFARGFLLLEDLGDQLYLPLLQRWQAQGCYDQGFYEEGGSEEGGSEEGGSEEGRPDADGPEEPDRLYRQAIASVVRLQTNVDKERLDPYDRTKLHREMALFDEWFCRGLLGLDLDRNAQALIAETYRLLEDAALAQPAVAVHRDYHSRNLLLLDPARFPDATGPGIVDFQDAVGGAYTYDLVSLLRDCYIRWPEARVQDWALGYLEQAQAAGIATDRDEETFLREFDLMGLQRHLKVMGIFSRLYLRDKKSAYLADIPLVIRYFRDVAARHAELATFLDWFETTVLPVAASTLDLQDEG